MPGRRDGQQETCYQTHTPHLQRLKLQRRHGTKTEKKAQQLQKPLADGTVSLREKRGMEAGKCTHGKPQVLLLFPVQET